MTSHTQVPFTDDSIFIDNPEPRCPCVLLLDNSGSMSGRPLAELNAGLKQFAAEVRADALAARRLELAIVSFGPVKVHQDFVGAEDFHPDDLEADGGTPMGEAILEAIELVRLRKKLYQQNGIAYYRPWIFMITDGAPTDDVSRAVKALKEAEAKKALAFFSVGVEGADFPTLKTLNPERAPLKLKGLAFRELFRWLSNSLSGVSRSQPSEPLRIAPPDVTPKGWASIA
jgi:uncharacterized protein YegL